MNHPAETLLVSLSALAVLIVLAIVIWRFYLRKKQPEAPVLFQSSGDKDKLTLINGIGPTLERKLNELGITNLRQIAQLTPEDIERMNGMLNFKGRIDREAWVAQARKLLEAGARPPAPRRQTGVRRTGAKATTVGVDGIPGARAVGKKTKSGRKRRKSGKKASSDS
ncbi:MAG: hypothetical protein WB783_03285 [Arenicellales bacterium]